MVANYFLLLFSSYTPDCQTPDKNRCARGTKTEKTLNIVFFFFAPSFSVCQVGAGFVRLASAHDRAMRGPLPPVVEPLPVLFSDRHGGWVVGAPDPAVVPVFLLGDVVLRPEEEGPGWGGDGGDGGGFGDSGEGGGAGRTFSEGGGGGEAGGGLCSSA